MVRELVRKLSNAHGASGTEESVLGIVRKELKKSVDEIIEDAAGNLIAVKRGSGFSVMLAAHTDEIGLMVKSIDDKGFLRFVTLGGWYLPTLHSQRVILQGTKGPIPGVLGGKPPHKMDEEERKKGVRIEDLFIDIGATSAADAESLGIEIGTPATIDRSMTELANGRLTGKAFDNRAGVAMLVKTLQQVNSPFTIYGAFTVQEEVGLKGGRTSAYTLAPDCAIATDTTFPGDFPGIDLRDVPVEIGKGPIITISEASGRGLMANRKMVAWLKETALNNDIPFQLEVGSGGNTDAAAITLERGGIPSTTLSIPARYIHSPVEVVDPRDIEAGIRLLVEALKTKPSL